MTRILIVDDDPVQLRLTAEIARRADFATATATGGAEALKLLRSDPGIAALILDLVMPDIDGMAVMETLQREGISIPIIVQTAHPSPETVASAMRAGAIDYFVKPVAPERLIISLQNALKRAELESLLRTDRNHRAGTLGIADLVAASPAMHRVTTLVQKAARGAIPVLIEGETGVGKELIARIIHGIGERAGRPFVALCCDALPPGQLDALLFGTASTPGKIAEAQGGTLLLDEIGELPLATQAGLLRLIQHGEIAPEGGRVQKVNVRIVATTSRRLLNLAKSGEFREDLYYRLNVLPLYAPPLRERREDIAPLASLFIARSAAESRKRVTGLSAPALALLTAYDWPGNVRQLEDVLYRATILSAGPILEIADFPQIVAELHGRDHAAKLAETSAAPSAPVHIDTVRPRRNDGDFKEAIPDRFLGDKGEIARLCDVERDLIAFALQHYGGRMSRIARALKIGRSTLYRKLREYGLDEGIESDAA